MRKLKTVSVCLLFLLVVNSLIVSRATGGQFRVLGRPYDWAQNLWALTTGVDAKIYGGVSRGSGPEGRLFYGQPPEPGYFVNLGGVSGEEVVYALTTGLAPAGMIYGGTGFNCYFFYYNPASGQITNKGRPNPPDYDEELVYDLTTGIDGRIFGGTGGEHERLDEWGNLFQYDPVTDEATNLGEPVIGEDIIASLTTVLSGPWEGLILCGTGHHNWLFLYDPFDPTHSIWLGPVVAGETYVKALCTHLTGDVMYGGTHPSGYLFRVSYEGVQVLGMAMGYPVGISSLICGQNGKIYGGLYNGRVFEYDPGLPFNPPVNPRDLGRPVEIASRIRSLTAGLEGYVYGGTGGTQAWLFLYDPYGKGGASQRDEELAASVQSGSLLLESHPNPITRITDIRYGIPNVGKPMRVSLRIYDATGTLVSTLVDEEQMSGSRTVQWEGMDNRGSAVRSGTYFCRLDLGGAVRTLKLVVLGR